MMTWAAKPLHDRDSETGNASPVAPNPAGQSILSRYFPGGVNPANLAMGAAIPTVIMGVSYMGFYYLLG